MLTPRELDSTIITRANGDEEGEDIEGLGGVNHLVECLPTKLVEAGIKEDQQDTFNIYKTNLFRMGESFPHSSVIHHY